MGPSRAQLSTSITQSHDHSSQVGLILISRRERGWRGFIRTGGAQLNQERQGNKYDDAKGTHARVVLLHAIVIFFPSPSYSLHHLSFIASSFSRLTFAHFLTHINTHDSRPQHLLLQLIDSRLFIVLIPSSFSYSTFSVYCFVFVKQVNITFNFSVSSPQTASCLTIYRSGAARDIFNTPVWMIFYLKKQLCKPFLAKDVISSLTFVTSWFRMTKDGDNSFVLWLVEMSCRLRVVFNANCAFDVLSESSLRKPFLASDNIPSLDLHHYLIWVTKVETVL